MAQAYVPIQTQTLTSAASSVTFSNVPQSYTDLQIVCSARNTSAFNAEAVLLSLNGSTSNFSGRYLQGNGSAVQTGTYTRFAFNMPAASSTSSTFSNSNLYFPNYTSSNNKSYTFDSVTENNGTEAYQTIFAGLWSDTSAITSITLTANSGNFAIGSTFTLYGVGGARASGGTITADARYTYHTFTSSGTFTALENIRGVEALVIAGGGSGGGGDSVNDNGGGGGGAGGVVYSGSIKLNAGTTYSAVIGAGGTGVANIGNNGSDSQFGFVTTALGGGGGACEGVAGQGGTNGRGKSGGSGGGSCSTTSGGTGTVGQGNDGGSNAGQSSGSGGGGAGGAGSSTTGSSDGARGGIGTSSYSAWGYATSTGELAGGYYYYAGGGGGGSYNGTQGGQGGLGGGGKGGLIAVGSPATANTGGGGGGSGNQSVARAGGNGGSGLVIIRYPN